ncbi:hypothetical protein CCHR01_18693, partial [Colletotrichum chrysophilum]
SFHLVSGWGIGKRGEKQNTCRGNWHPAGLLVNRGRGLPRRGSPELQGRTHVPLTHHWRDAAEDNGLVYQMKHASQTMRALRLRHLTAA